MSQTQKKIAPKEFAVKAEAKLIQIVLQMLARQAVVGAVHKSLCVSDDGVEPMKQTRSWVIDLVLMDVILGERLSVTG